MHDATSTTPKKGNAGFSCVHVTKVIHAFSYTTRASRIPRAPHPRTPLPSMHAYGAARRAHRRARAHASWEFPRIERQGPPHPPPPHLAEKGDMAPVAHQMGISTDRAAGSPLDPRLKSWYTLRRPLEKGGYTPQTRKSKGTSCTWPHYLRRLPRRKGTQSLPSSPAGSLQRFSDPTETSPL